MDKFIVRSATAAIMLFPSTGEAVEGGLETYLLGSRDSMAGALPPAGTSINNDFVTFSGHAPAISMGGAVVVDPKLTVSMYKFNGTHVFEETVGGARFGLNLNVPLVNADMGLQGELSSGLTGAINDSTTAFGDITITPLFNWSEGNLHRTLALQFFLPTGSYDTAVIDVPNRTADVLNTGKNRFAFDPTYAVTWMNPDSGLELTGAFGVTFSAKNSATDYQTAPEAHLEATVMQHMPNKMAFGLTGYAYNQIGDDSGSGADGTRAILGAESLSAEVYGLGPVWTWQTTVGDNPLSIKAKYIKEFGARRRFESDKIWVTLGLVF